MTTNIILMTCAIVFAIAGLILQVRIALLTARAKYAPLAEERANWREQYKRETDALMAKWEAIKAEEREAVWDEAHIENAELGAGVKIESREGYSLQHLKDHVFPNDNDAEAAEVLAATRQRFVQLCPECAKAIRERQAATDDN